MPLHQRKLAWGKRDVREWYASLLTVKMLSVTFVTYQICEDGNWSNIYLNDGGNRVAYASTFYESCEEYGLSKTEAEQLLRGISINLVHWHHNHWREAVDEFIKVNKGTGLTPYEKNHYELKYLGDHVAGQLDRLHRGIRMVESRFSIVKDGREQEQTYRRADYALLLRYFDSEVSKLDYDATRKRSDDETIEGRLRQRIEHMSPFALESAVGTLLNWVQEEAALIEVIWKKYKERYSGHEKMGKSPVARTMLRYLFNIGVVRRHLRLDINEHMAFVAGLFENTNGSSTVTVHPERINMALEKLSRTRAIGKMIGQEGYAAKIQRETARTRRKSRKSQIPGYANSHLRPFSTEGEGPTVPEPAILNRARGALPMTEPEIEFVHGV